MGLSTNGKPITPYKGSWAEDMAKVRAENEGRNAAYRGEPYSTNPYPDSQPALKLAWSTGHNGARAKVLSDRYG